MNENNTRKLLKLIKETTLDKYKVNVSNISKWKLMITTNKERELLNKIAKTYFGEFANK